MYKGINNYESIVNPMLSRISKSEKMPWETYSKAINQIRALEPKFKDMNDDLVKNYWKEYNYLCNEVREGKIEHGKDLLFYKTVNTYNNLQIRKIQKYNVITL